MNIYEDGQGDELINPQNYNSEISLYLEAEGKRLSKIVVEYDTVIEVGCMNGRYADFVLQLNKKYIGIDLVQRYIESAKKRYKSAIDNKEAAFFCAGLEDLHTVLAHITPQNLKKVLAVFPFNSFGNIENIDRAADVISNSVIDFVIFTYKTDKFTQIIRENYYLNSGFINLDCICDETGVRFISTEGLNSIAYSEKWVDKKLGGKGKELKIEEFATIGKSFQILSN
jgi:SAM-dependent methyltransferase